MRGHTYLNRQGCGSVPGTSIIFLESWIQIRMSVKSWIRIRINVKIRSFRSSKWNRGGPWTLTMELWILNMETWRVLDQIPITLMRSRIQVRIKVKSRIRIRIKVMPSATLLHGKHEFWNFWIPPHICTMHYSFRT